MAERKFRFVSPGIFINEVDNSQLPNDLPDVGPIIIGRADYGPGMRPIRVNSPSEFIEFYGNPNLWWFIARVNNLKNNNIPAGTSLRIPIDTEFAKGL